MHRLVHEDGKSVTEAARTLKIGRSTAYAALAQAVWDQELHCCECGAGITAAEVACPSCGTDDPTPLARDQLQEAYATEPVIDGRDWPH